MPGPTFYRTLAEAIAALPERLPCVAAFGPAGQARTPLAVIDADPSWPDFGEVVVWSELPNAGKELHTSAGTPAPARCATTAPAGAPLPDRPGIGWSRSYVLDTRPDSRTPKSDSVHVGRSNEDRRHIKEAPHDRDRDPSRQRR